MGIEIDPLTGAPILSNVAPFTIPTDTKSVESTAPLGTVVPVVSGENDSVASALDELALTKSAEEPVMVPSAIDELSLAADSFDEKIFGMKLKRIESILHRGMDSQQVKSCLRDIKTVLLEK